MFTVLNGFFNNVRTAAIIADRRNTYRPYFTSFDVSHSMRSIFHGVLLSHFIDPIDLDRLITRRFNDNHFKLIPFIY